MALVDAPRSGDLDASMSMLAKDARLVADGGGKVQAALNVIDGAGRLTAFYMALIEPFRRFMVYPALGRDAQRSWSRAYGAARA